MGMRQVLLWVFLAPPLWAQVFDDFSDGDLTANPTWVGDVSRFIVADGQLRSNAGILPNSQDYYLATASARALDVQWDFFVNLRFATSGANYIDFFLLADRAELTSSAVQGYFVRVGDTADEIVLYRTSAGVNTRLVSSPAGLVSSSTNNPYRIRVIRTDEGVWTLSYDRGAIGVYEVRPEVTDNTFTTGSHLGIRIRQSAAASVANNHFFDDIYAGEIIRDTTPPQALQVFYTEATSVFVLYDEPVEVSSIAPENFTLIPGTLIVVDALLQADARTLRLVWSGPLQNLQTYTLTLRNIADLAGNVQLEQSLEFQFILAVPAQPKDIILSEMLPDPTPQIGLPNAEFVELFNRSNHPIDIGGWRLSDGSSTGTFPSRLLLPGSYWVVTTTGNAALFSGPVIGLPNFPTLNNNGDILTLRDAGGQLIDSVAYTLAWYRDEDKAQGGWSLELIDTNNPCGEEDNWAASEDPTGGTPGRPNSIAANKPDLIGPKLLAAIATSPFEILLTFNEKLERSLSTENFSTDPHLPILSARFTSASLREVELRLAAPVQVRTPYRITAQGIRDCSGNFILPAHTQAVAVLPEEAEPGDIIVNEILFNPRPGGVDYVEFYNRSAKFINVRDWRLRSVRPSGTSNAILLTSSHSVWEPGAFRVVTSNPAIVQMQYPNHDASRFIASSLPSLPDAEGNITLFTDTDRVVDSFSYLASYHSPLIRNPDGVALERISHDAPTQEPANWRSAASAVGFGTPGLPNSMARPNLAAASSRVFVDPAVFSPQALHASFTTVQYRFDVGGLSATVLIVDAHGREVKTLARNETLGTEGFFRWDGDMDNGLPARSGYYAVWFEVFDVSGYVQRFRERIVILNR